MSRIQQGEGLNLLEFSGVPGAGKSYLVRRAVADEITRPMEWYSQGRRTQRMWRKCGLLLRNLPTAIATLSWARRLLGLYPPVGRLRRWKVLFNWAFVDSLIRDAACHRGGSVVVDQGIAQALWSTQFGARGECPIEAVRTLMRRYLEGLPVAEWTVVRVTAPQEMVRARIAGREGWSPVDRDLASMEEARCAERVAGIVLNGLTQAEGAPRITIKHLLNDGEGAVARCRELVSGDKRRIDCPQAIEIAAAYPRATSRPPPPPLSSPRLKRPPC